MSRIGLQSGVEMVIPKQFRRYELNQAASSSARVVVDRWEQDRGPWWDLLLTWWVPADPVWVLRQRAILDLRSGIRVYSWKPGVQQQSGGPGIEDAVYRCALSSHGDYVAESGDGRLELYRLP
jgi:hypothetical protein